jgi:hypothetical protein
VRSVLRTLVCLAIGSSIAFAALPGQVPRPEVAKTDCCAKMQGTTGECEHHQPQPNPNKECCAACAFGLAAVVQTAAPFLYPPPCDETFAAYISSGHFLPHRPPVPPPRA